MQYLLQVVSLCILFGYSQSQCEVLGIDRNDVSDIRDCHKIYTVLEEALISDADNLYTLQEVFFSSEYRPPSMLKIDYHIETAVNNGSVYIGAMIWSRSSLFKYVSPFVFFICEPAIIALAFEAIHVQLIPVEIDLFLSVNTTLLPQNISNIDKEAIHALSTITSRIKAYAISQDRLSTRWDGSNNGYTIYPNANMIESLAPLVLSTALLLISSLVMAKFIDRKFHSQSESIQKHLHSLSLFYSVGTVMLGLNVTELVCSIFIFYVFTGKEFSLLLSTKGIYIMTYVIMTISFAIIGWKKAKVFPIFSCCCCCCCLHSKVRHKLIHSLIFVSVSSFALSLLISICPTLLLIFVYPIEIISLLLFIGTSLFCTIFIFAILISLDMINERVKATSKVPSQVNKLMKPHALRFLRRLLYMLPCFAFIILMFVYMKLLTKTDYTGSSKILQAISSLSPSLGLGAVGYYARRWLKYFHEQHSEELTSTVETDDTKDTELTLVGDTQSEDKKQGNAETELSANNSKDDDGESTQLLVTVEVEESNV